MAFIIASLKSLADIARLVLAVLFLFSAPLLSAAEIEVTDPQLVASEDGFVLSADFNIDFNSRLEEAVNKGVTLYFVAEFNLVRPRWYWLDEKLVSQTQTIRLSYHALTRQYRVSTGGLHQSYSSLSEALRVLARLRNWVVIEKSADKPNDKTPRPGESLLGSLRMRLDINQLPKPFQIAAVGSKEWNLSSEWKNWPLVFPAGEAK